MSWQLAVAATFLMQAAISLLNSAVIVSAPVLTAAAGVPIERIGYFASLSTVGSMWYLMSCGALLPRIGPLRLLQLGLLLAAAGAALVLPANWSLLLLGALLFGIGYGPQPPATSDILARHAPPERRSLAFSIKQSGVPAGNALAGIMIPAVALAFDWRIAIALAILIVIASMLLVQPARAALDAERDPARPIPLRRMFSPAILAEPVRALRLSRSLLPVTFAGFCFASSQSSFFSFFVAYLSVDLNAPLAQAGLAYAILQLMGAGGRIACGAIADRTSGIATLIVLAFASALALLLTAGMDATWRWPIVLAVGGFAGVAAVSWNGVYLAEVARLVPRERVGEATSGSTFFTFIGYAVGPAAFAQLVERSGSYDLAFACMAALPLLGAVALFAARRRSA